jgi:hypothetical protein
VRVSVPRTRVIEFQYPCGETLKYSSGSLEVVLTAGRSRYSTSLARDPVPYLYDPLSAITVWPWYWQSRYTRYWDANGNPV